MARKTKAKENTEQSADAPILDTTNTAVKQLIKKGKERGYVTHDELNEALPQDELSSEQIEDVMSSLSEMGVSVVDAAEELETANENETSKATGNVSDDVSNSDDPVRMYLREMGSVELLSREGEIAIAKRIEAGREMMIGGICECPMAINTLLMWAEQVREGAIPLRDIIDLDVTYMKVKGVSVEDNSVLGSGVAAGLVSDDETDDDEDDEAETDSDEEEDEVSAADNADDDSDEDNMSMASMEDAVFDEVMEQITSIQKLFSKYSALQDKKLVAAQKGKTLTQAQSGELMGLRIKLTEEMQSIYLNTNRLDSLNAQMLELSKWMATLDNDMMQLATGAGISRSDFIANWYGSETLTQWPKLENPTGSKTK